MTKLIPRDAALNAAWEADSLELSTYGAEQTAALEAIRAEARAQGMREAAVICRNVGFKDHPDSVAYDAEFQVLAAITKGDKA